MRIGVIGSMHVAVDDGGVLAHLSLGRIVDELAELNDELILCLPATSQVGDETRDYVLRSANVSLVPQPMYGSSLGALRKFAGIVRAYFRAVRRSDCVVIRGMVPFIEWLYLACALLGVRPVHWLVGDPQALLASHRRRGGLRDLAMAAVAWYQSVATKVGSRITNGSLLCNGQALADRYPGPRTHVTVSSTIREDEIVGSSAACRVPGRFRILFVGFLRPEKGLQYLVDAVSRIRTDRDWTLTVVGTFGAYGEYKKAIDAHVTTSGLTDRIEWLGYIPYGERLREVMVNADVLVLPTLSEGTPRVLVEARANGLPIVATNVGGIPTSVRDGVDGLLVPPKDAPAIASALERLEGEPGLAESLVSAGLESVRNWTVEKFARRLHGICMEMSNE